ncbi:MAG: sugar transferase [Mycobacteriales bacterium]|nr:sugar transferase [Frankia sp.]
MDALAITLAAFVAAQIRFGATPARLGLLSYHVLVGLAAPLWVALLALNRAYEPRFLGVGSDEYKQVLNASVRLTAVVATVAYVFKFEIARGFVAITLPLGTLLLLVGRYVARRVLYALRKRGRCSHRVLVVGSGAEAAELTRRVMRERVTGFLVVGACVPGEVGQPLAHDLPSVPIVGTPGQLPSLLRRYGADTVAVAGNRVVTGPTLRRLAWELEGTGADLVVAPAITDVAGPRIHIRPVAGLPLLHVEEPELTGGRRLLKTGFDHVVATVLALLTLPLLLAIAIAIKLDSRGPVLYRQVRVGHLGQEFCVFKFRSMRTDADRMLAQLRSQNVHLEGPLFKMRRDPRVTRVGRVLRKYSLDELPQLFNVIKGEMSLVGPRPPLPVEVADYGYDVRRRLLVKPGITGLWQISGRSDLPWSETVRLDLQYVENWSLALDLTIIYRTIFAVLKGRGAY